MQKIANRMSPFLGKWVTFINIDFQWACLKNFQNLRSDGSLKLLCHCRYYLSVMSLMLLD